MAWASTLGSYKLEIYVIKWRMPTHSSSPFSSSLANKASLVPIPSNQKTRHEQCQGQKKRPPSKRKRQLTLACLVALSRTLPSEAMSCYAATLTPTRCFKTARAFSIRRGHGEHINTIGEYHFSDEKLKDSLGILPVKPLA